MNGEADIIQQWYVERYRELLSKYHKTAHNQTARERAVKAFLKDRDCLVEEMTALLSKVRASPARKPLALHAG